MIDRHKCVSVWCRLITDARVSKSLTARGSNILEWSARVDRVLRYAGTVTLPGIAFNLLAQTSQLAARINLGSPPMWRDPGRAREQERKKNDSQWTEKRADGEEQLALRCEEKRRERRERKEKQSADHVGDGRPSVVREPETEVLSYEDSQCHGSGENGFTKPRSSAYDGRRAHSSSDSSSSPHRCCLDGGTIGQTGCHNPLLFSYPFTPAVLRLRVPLLMCTFLVPEWMRDHSLFLSFIRVN